MAVVGGGVLVTDVLRNNLFKTMDDEKHNKLFYGVELECQIPSRVFYTNGVYDSTAYNRIIAETEEDFKDHAILKADGSYEVCTVPATLNYHKAVLWNKYFNNSVKYVDPKTLGLGIHVHFSREALTELQMAKMLIFFNESCNYEFLKNIADREFHGHSMRGQKSIDKTEPVNTILTKGLTEGRRAIHISNRNQGRTAEVRIFQNNPSPQGVFQALEFIDAAIVYFHKHGNIDKALHYEPFLEWFDKELMSEVYPYFNNNLIRLNYRSHPADVLEPVTGMRQSA